MTDQKRKKRTLGVTLIEVLVAMVILSIGLYMTYNTFPLGFAASYRSKNKTIASELAQQVLERVIKNQVKPGCYHNSTGETCRCYPLDTRDPSENHDENDFDCRYWYGGMDSDNKVQNSSYCSWHMGTKDVGNWKRFVTTNDTDPLYLWWYHIDVTPVIDPAKKFRSTGDLARITVSVRGPIDNMSYWDVARKKGYKPAEVIISTLKANKFLACTTVNTSGRWNGLKTDGMALYVNNVRNFTILNRDSLTLEENRDRPKVTIYCRNQTKNRTLNMVERDGNFYNLDNCLITRSATYKFFYNESGSIGPFISNDKQQTINFQSSMTNRIIYVVADTWGNPETTYKIPGELHLMYPIYTGDSNPAATYSASLTDTPNPNIQKPADLTNSGNAGFTSRYTRANTNSTIPAWGDPAFPSFAYPPNESAGNETTIWWRDYYRYNPASTDPNYVAGYPENQYITSLTYYNANPGSFGWWQEVGPVGSPTFRLFIDKFVHANLAVMDGSEMKLYKRLDNYDQYQTYYVQQLTNVRAPQPNQ